MADIWSKQKRSEVMSLIRSGGNKATELRLIRIFREYGITGWRRNQPLLGKPDFTFRRGRIVVFVDGCFWHGCPKCYKRPKSNRKYWDAKIAANRKRDRYVTRTTQPRVASRPHLAASVGQACTCCRSRYLRIGIWYWRLLTGLRVN
ncbi:MAG: hypothetical protein U1C96_02160 [Gallionella sp.]|nr:hypothetical protein [Gallionella sp.]